MQKNLNRVVETLMILIFFSLVLIPVKSCYAQALVSGKLLHNDKWNSKLYLSTLNDFSGSFELVDSIDVKQDGSFAWKGHIPDSTILYRLLLPPNGGNFRSFIEGYADNYVYLLLKNGDKYSIQANADSIYYSASISGNEYGKQIKTISSFKKPFANMALNMEKEMKNNPGAAQSIREDAMNKLPEIIGNYKDQLKDFLVRNEDPAVTILGLYQYYLASFGTYDSSLFLQLLNRPGTEQYSIGRLLKDQIKDGANKRVGIIFPSVVFETLDGKKINSDDWKHDWILIDMWASWCKPCRQANKTYLPEIQQKLGDKKLSLISISVDESMDAWKKAVKDDKINWLQLRETEKIGLVTRLNIFAYPTYMVINKNREIVFEANNPIQLKEFLSKQFDVKF
ncbi:MAG: TlpA family protein disulfide reductase [Flavitalea sp.]